MKKFYRFFRLAFAFCVGCAAAGGEDPHQIEHEHEHSVACEGEAHEDGAHGKERVRLKVDSRSRHIINMQVEKVPEISRVLSSSVYGRLAIPEHAMETYALPAAGRISVLVKSAQSVKKGDILYTLQSPMIAEQMSAIQSLRSNGERCEEEMRALQARIGRLESIGVRNSDLDEQLTFKRAEREQIRRDTEVAEARLRMLSLGAELTQDSGSPTLVVRANADGVVRNVGVTQGSWGEQGAAVLTMSFPQSLEIVAPIYSGSVPRISEILAWIPVGREMRQVDGSWRLSDQENAETQTRTLYFAPRELPSELRAGQLCRLDLYDDAEEAGGVMIPDSALVRVGTDDVVFVQEADDCYAMVRVHAGRSYRGMTPVRGISPGQSIVTKGGYELKYLLPAGDRKKAGHFHADGQFHEGED